MSYSKPLPLPANIPYSTQSGTAPTNYSRMYSTVFNGVKAGEKVDDWRAKIASGKPAASPYTLDVYNLYLGSPISDSVVLYQAVWPATKSTEQFYGYPGAYSFPKVSLVHLSVDSSKARSVALSKLYKKLESERSELNSYAVLAEFGDVIRQFGRPFGAIVDAFIRHENRLIYEKRRLVGSKTWKQEKFAKIIADTWLETSFGLIPLFSDAVSLAEAFGRHEYELAETPRLRDRMRTRAADVLSTVSISGPEQANGTTLYYQVERKTITEARAQYVVGLEGELRAEFGSNARLLQLLGLEPRNLPLAVWEATPWSWLVDYGTNVQQILSAAAAVVDRVSWIVLTETKRTTLTSYPVGNGPAYAGNGSWPLESAKYSARSGPGKDLKGYVPAGGIKLTRTTLTRSLPSSLGVPPIYFKSPLGDLKKTANLLALAVSRSSKRFNWLD